jgi:hypothetical protein
MAAPKAGSAMIWQKGHQAAALGLESLSQQKIRIILRAISFVTPLKRLTKALR